MKLPAFQIFAICVAASLLQAEQIFDLDFSTSHDVSILTNAGLSLEDIGLGKKYRLQEGEYRIELDDQIVFYLPTRAVSVLVERENEEKIRSIEWITTNLTESEADEAVHRFMEAFGIDGREKYEDWMMPIRERKFPSDFIGLSPKIHYPSIGFAVHYSFNKDIPIFLRISLDWSEWLHERRGTSPETNVVKDFEMNVPTRSNAKSSSRGH